MINSSFGERENSPEAGWVKPIGESIARSERLIEDAQEHVFFEAARTGTVESEDRSTTDLPPEFRERITVVVTWPGPLTPGDTLYAHGETLGMGDEIVDDGHSEPRLDLAAPAQPTLTVERRLPTAAQSLQLTWMGPYDLTTQLPLAGQLVRDNQLMWLAKAGGHALVGEFAVYKTNDVLARTRVYETLVNQATVEHPWVAAHPHESAPATASSPAPHTAPSSAFPAAPLAGPISAEDPMAAFLAIPGLTPSSAPASAPPAPI